MGGKGSGRIGVKCNHGITKSYCKTCQRKRRGYKGVSKKQTNIKLFVRNYKLSLKHCVICMIEITETNFMMFALDHRDPSQKLFNLSQASRQPRHLVMDECQKCDLMCHNCHHVKTHQNRDHITRRDETKEQNECLPLLLLMQEAS